jgi:BirA family biotin operon repressor/biotin-[acetyl-CoA-carboxylase] ligase
VVDYSSLRGKLPTNAECFVFESIPSTNDYLSALPSSNNIQVCVAREQTNGRGQYQRQWQSKKDSSVLFSVRKNFKTATSLNGLSSVIGLAIIDVLGPDYGVSELKLKWPNDVYFNNQKLAGILIENTVQNKSQSVVIGIGVNNNIKGELDCETPWIDITQILNITPKIETLTAKIINKVIKYCYRFEKHGLDTFKPMWSCCDYLENKKLELSHKGRKVVGVAKGISKQGALLIEINDETIEVFSSEQIKLI